MIFDTHSAISRRQDFVNSLAEYGRMVDFEITAPISESLGVSGHLKSITFHKISLSTIHFAPSEIKYIQRLVGQGIKNKKVQPLETSVFPASQVVEAFKFYTSANIIGRVVVEIRGEEEKKNTLPVKKSVAALPRLFFSSEKAFVISGKFSRRF